jgi:hypothetical protein
VDPYKLEDIKLKNLYLSGRWKVEGQCKERDRIKLSFVDHHASGILIQRWLDGRITWRRLMRIALDLPGAHEEQLEEANAKERKRKTP